ncbi:glutamate-rich WD repeat-containing protein 1 isoform X2 [Copidosoma floridanum]|uniref:glutamate-rich WD repeat-containing protein 1 isoform X2 n=1 Tax=Copidosoma floridanum TaxID=29053 RepID=UPI0006C9C019|nr:glutamate-rich WD repeat-containing protein 1 isoform X2 [Copidosoma floridanum]
MELDDEGSAPSYSSSSDSSTEEDIEIIDNYEIEKFAGNKKDKKNSAINEVDKKEKVYLPGTQLEEGEELVADKSAYCMLHQAQTEAPCLSFDVIKDRFGDLREKYPLSMYLLAGTQAARTNVNNLLVIKMYNLHGKKLKNPDSDSDESIKYDSEESSEQNEDEEAKFPKMRVASIKHQGCVNRVRCSPVGNTILAASWSELGRVSLWNLSEQLKAVDNKGALSSYEKKSEKNDTCVKPLFTFKGHTIEGYSLDWSSAEPGTLATGDCNGNIHIWRCSDNGGNCSWHVDQRAYNSHAPYSVEDLQWKPDEQHVLASCSVDKSIKIWDTRTSSQSTSMLTAAEAHSSDVNVISWNKNETQFIVSGGDDGVLRVWDLRQFNTNRASPVAVFKQHTAPITTVEWHPYEATILASGGADDVISQWDLSVEVDQTGNDLDKTVAQLPPQLLFIHQGQSDVKELHWHPQCPGVVISTAHSGFNIFRTISV